MVGFVEEIDEPAEAAPATEQPAAAPAAAVVPAVRVEKSLRRRNAWATAALRREVERGLLRRGFAAWWGFALAGRPARQGVRAEALCTQRAEALLRHFYGRLTSAREVRLGAAEAYKAEGNACFKAGDLDAALCLYTKALDAAPASAAEKGVYYCNRAACHTKLEEWRDAERDCSNALKVTPGYEKALARRMVACEKLGGDDVFKAHEDAEALLKLQPGNAAARATAARLGPEVEKRRKQQMDEAVDSLKGIGNSILGYFNMSLDNFKTTQNPDGTYGVQFQQ